VPNAKAHDPAEEILQHRGEINETESSLRTARIASGLVKSLLIGAPSALLAVWIASYFLVGVIDLVPVWSIVGTLAGISLVVSAILGGVNSDKGGRLLAPRRIALELEHLYDEQAVLFSEENVNLQLRQHFYRASMLRDVSSIRGRGDVYRSVNNAFQSVIIVGSLATTTVISLSQTDGLLKWLAVGFSLAVGLAAGFTGYFKYRERAFYLRQTADDIEEQLNAYSLGLTPYAAGTPEERLAGLTARVESIRVAQQRREQQLDQPKGSKDDS
jgi:hypothetical protein